MKLLGFWCNYWAKGSVDGGGRGRGSLAQGRAWCLQRLAAVAQARRWLRLLAPAQPAGAAGAGPRFPGTLLPPGQRAAFLWRAPRRPAAPRAAAPPAPVAQRCPSPCSRAGKGSSRLPRTLLGTGEALGVTRPHFPGSLRPRTS